MESVMGPGMLVLALSSEMYAVLVGLIAGAVIAFVFWGARAAFISSVRSGKMPSRARSTFNWFVWPVVFIFAGGAFAIAWFRLEIFYDWLKWG